MEPFLFQTIVLFVTTIVNAGYSTPNAEFTTNQPSPPVQPVSPVTSPIDLTQTLDERAPAWNGTAQFQVVKSIGNEDRGYFYATRDISLGEHVGTHMDAPYHFNKHGATIDKIPVSRFVASAIVVDGKSDHAATIGLEDLNEWHFRHGPLPSHCVVLFRFNWSRHYWQHDHYYGRSPGFPEFPGITEELAAHLASLNAVVGVGLDTPSIDPGQEKSMAAHRALAAGGKYVLENLALSMSLPPKGWTIIVMPTKIRNGTGAPCRVVAVPNGFNAASSIATSLIFIIALTIFGRVLAS